MKKTYNEIKKFLYNLFYSGGQVSSKRFYAGMMFINTIVLSYVSPDKLELIKAFLYTACILVGVIASEKVLHKPGSIKKDKEDEK